MKSCPESDLCGCSLTVRFAVATPHTQPPSPAASHGNSTKKTRIIVKHAPCRTSAQKRPQDLLVHVSSLRRLPKSSSPGRARLGHLDMLHDSKNENKTSLLLFAGLEF